MSKVDACRKLSRCYPFQCAGSLQKPYIKAFAGTAHVYTHTHWKQWARVVKKLLFDNRVDNFIRAISYTRCAFLFSKTILCFFSVRWSVILRRRFCFRIVSFAQAKTRIRKYFWWQMPRFFCPFCRVNPYFLCAFITFAHLCSNNDCPKMLKNYS